MKAQINEKEPHNDEKETGRLEAFSDGVFAVAITLLVLNIKVPEIDPTNLPPDYPTAGWLGLSTWDLVRSQLPNFSAFVISFFTIGIMWLNHHKIFKHIKRVDTGLILLNTLLLLVIVFIPVPTALLAPYLFDSTNHAAAILYSGTFFFMAIFFNIIWRYASYKGRLLSKNANMQEVKGIDQQYMFGPLLYIIALILACFNTPASALFQFLLTLFFALPGKKKGSKQAQSALAMDEEE